MLAAVFHYVQFDDFEINGVTFDGTNTDGDSMAWRIGAEWTFR